ncbi:histidine phosphatase family protein [Isoptericola cucumis]|uniref:Phosphoglycerate mutase n=1 Tax=Isoptericola cucumis TaxID=1776856 RepID=A0ABQ2BC49_9MICO|nr:histidine phosphatase family protein [Isoptericola cucumis]GGI10899.1 putative phosphoglycerate mutase [Isoptericola cucumis]
MAATDLILPAPPIPGVVPARARKVFVVTHPEATHHVDGVVGGQFDSELTVKGLEDADLIAAALADRIGEERSRHVVSSDLRRAARTAAAIGVVLGVEPELDSRLREKSYGLAGGREQSWLDERFVAPPAVGDRMSHVEGLDGAEVRLDVACRVYEAMSEALARDVDDLVVVTHGYAATFVVAAWIGMPIEAAGHVAFHVRSGSITTLREDDFFHNRAVLAVGETAHLQR